MEENNFKYPRIMLRETWKEKILLILDILSYIVRIGNLN